MPSPFRGMDPYLEDAKLWTSFQHLLVHSLYQILLPGLMDRYQAWIAQRSYSLDRLEHFIEIRSRADSALVTLADVVSPANKTCPEGREAYLATRRAGRQANCSLVEIDLVLQG